ncbi:MAG: YdeI/OmpD-associated family protein [Acidimicrobiales bacterium]
MTAHKGETTPELIVADLAAWRCWLAAHATASDGVWLVLAKKGTTHPTSLTYDEALEEALCHGWVDGQLTGGHEGTFRRRFTPRRRASTWSMRNIRIVERLVAEGRMRPGGMAVVERAQADGTWDAAYAGAATIDTPDDFQAVLGANRAAAEMFAQLDGANRYAVLYRITTARRADTRARRIEQLVDMLAQRKTIHPNQKRT